MRMLGIGALLAATLAAFLAAPASAVPVRSQFRISEFGPAMDSETDALDTTMAYNAAADEYLVVWAGGPEFGDFEIYGRRLDSDGDPIGGHFQISSQGSPDVVGEPDEAEPAVAYDPELNQYLVVWSGDHEDATPPLVDQEFEIFGQLIDADGDAVGADDFRISDMGTEADGNFDAEQPAVTYNSTSNEYLVVWMGDDDTGLLSDQEKEVFGQRLDGDGAPAGANDFRISVMGGTGDPTYGVLSPAVAWSSAANEYLVAWSGDDNSGMLVNDELEIWGRRVSAANSLQGSQLRLSDMGSDGNAGLDAGQPALAYNSKGDEYLATWSGDDDTPPLVNEEFEIFGQRVDANGAALGTNDFRISDMGPNGNTAFAAMLPAIAYLAARDEHVVAWQGDDDSGSLVDQEFEIYEQRLGATGSEIGTNDLRVSTMGADGNQFFDGLRPATAYNSDRGEYLIGWEGSDNTGATVIDEFEIRGSRWAPQCADDLDNDGDGKIDFPADPDCSSSGDDDETFVPPPPPPPLPPTPPAPTPPPAPSEDPGCISKVEFGPVEALASCFQKTATGWTSSGLVRVNGVDIQPRTFDYVELNTAAFRLISKSGTIARIGNIPIYEGALDFDVRQALELNVDEDDAAQLGGFPIIGKASLKFASKRTELELIVRLPPVFNGLTAGARVATDNPVGLRLDALRVEVPRVSIGPFEAAGATVVYDAGPNIWAGVVAVRLPSPEPQPAVAAGITFKDGRLQQLSALVDGLNVPFGKGVFLQRVRFSLATGPLTLGGGMGLSAGPKVGGFEAISIDGALGYQFSNPGVFKIQGDVKVFRVFDLLSGFVNYRTNGALTLGGKLTWTWIPDVHLPVVGKIPGFIARGTLSGYIDRDLAFSAEGTGTLQLSLLQIAANVLVSNVGTAACGSVDFDTPLGKVSLALGVGYKWASQILTVLAGACDLGPYRPVASASAARDDAVLRLGRGLPAASIAVAGESAPPKVILRGPGGQRVRTPSGLEPLKRGSFLVIQSPQLKATYVVVARPRAGSWRISLAPGSSAVKSIRQADGLPRASVLARVRGRGRRRTLTWRLVPIPGQRVRFVERGPDTAHVLGETRRARGRLHFRPGDGRAGRRRIFAEVLQDGLMRKRVAVAAYRAPRPHRLRRPDGVRAARRGSVLRIGWRRLPGAARYAVRVTVSDGRVVEVLTRRRSARVAGVDRSESARVSVSGRDTLNQRGPAAELRVRSARPRPRRRD